MPDDRSCVIAVPPHLSPSSGYVLSVVLVTTASFSRITGVEAGLSVSPGLGDAVVTPTVVGVVAWLLLVTGFGLASPPHTRYARSMTRTSNIPTRITIVLDEPLRLALEARRREIEASGAQVPAAEVVRAVLREVLIPRQGGR